MGGISKFFLIDYKVCKVFEFGIAQAKCRCRCYFLMFLRIPCSIIEIQILHEQVIGNVEFTRVDGYRIGQNTSTVAHQTAVFCFECRYQAVGNASYTSIFVAVTVIQCLHTASAGNVIFGGSHLDMATISYGSNALYQSFTIGSFSDNNSPVEVLQCTGQNFGSGSRGAVHDHSQFHIRENGFGRSAIGFVHLARFSFGNDHFSPLWNEIAYNLHSFIHQTATVVAYINNQGGNLMLFHHIGNHRFDLSRSFIGKIVEQEVSCFITGNGGVTYRIKLDILAQKFLNQRFLFTRSGYFDCNFRSVFPFK